MPSVLFIAPSAYPLGGVATWLDYLIPGLKSMGWEAKLGLVSGHWHDPDAYLAAHPGLSAIMIRNPTGSREGRARAVAKVIRSVAPDLVAGVQVPDAYAAVGKMRLKYPDAPRVALTMHSIARDLCGDMLHFRDVLDGVICSNRLACRLAVEDGGVEGNRVHYAPYGVEVPDRVASVRGEGRLRIAYVGRLEETQKRVSDLVAMAEALHRQHLPFVLSIVGDGPEGPALRNRLEPFVARGQVQFMGVLAHEEVLARIFPVTDVMVLPSSWETGPIVIWEAMAYGVAVASTRYVGSGLEGALVDGENCLLFEVGDVPKAVAAVQALSREEYRKKIARGGRQLVMERYSIARSVAAWARAFEMVLESSGKSLPQRRPRCEARGRLDQAFGCEAAESIRSLLHLSFQHAGPGSEWPHSYDSRRCEDAAYVSHAERVDRAAL